MIMKSLLRPFGKFAYGPMRSASQGSQPPKAVYKHYLLIYDTAPDYLERRGQFRDAHLGLAWDAAKRGELVLGGALANPVDGAILLFKGETQEPAENFVKADPYVKNGLIKNWRIREWTTVAGEGAASPVRPKGY